MLSIIIPTLNEEKFLPFLLKSIENQHFFNEDYEIIVADADSKDKTVALAKDFGCKIVKGGSPAEGRNRGAKIAKGDLFLFLDADVILPEDFLEKSLREFQNRSLGGASFLIAPQTNRRFLAVLFNLFYNFPLLFFEKIFPHGAMAILIKKSIFEQVGGFDEKLNFAEDHNLLQKVAKKARFGLIRSTRILASTRRFEKEGWIKTYLKYLLAELHLIFRGPIKKEIFKYPFGIF